MDLLRCVAILAAIASLCGCARDFQYARDVGPTALVASAPAHGEVTVVWHFRAPEVVDTLCGGEGRTEVHGCAVRDADGARCVVVAVEPRDFQDRERLAVLGHEAWHCFGSRHS